MDNGEHCSACGEPVTDALARTVRLSVDRSQIDAQRLCPECFADWIDRYETEMQAETDPTVVEEDGDELIVD
jgi:transcriptional regulator NrdR family protein